MKFTKKQSIKMLGKPMKLYDAINPTALRQLWFESAKKCSIGILLFGFTSPAFDLPQTLESILAEHPKIKRRFDRWLNHKNPSFPNCLHGEQLAHMLRDPLVNKTKRRRRK